MASARSYEEPHWSIAPILAKRILRKNVDVDLVSRRLNQHLQGLNAVQLVLPESLPSSNS